MAFINTETLSQYLKRVEFSVFEVKLQLYYLSDQFGQVLSRPRRFKSQFIYTCVGLCMVAGKSSAGIPIGIQHFNGQFAMFSVSVDLKPVPRGLNGFVTTVPGFSFASRQTNPSSRSVVSPIPMTPFGSS